MLDRVKKHDPLIWPPLLVTGLNPAENLEPDSRQPVLEAICEAFTHAGSPLGSQSAPTSPTGRGGGSGSLFKAGSPSNKGRGGSGERPGRGAKPLVQFGVHCGKVAKGVVGTLHRLQVTHLGPGRHWSEKVTSLDLGSIAMTGDFKETLNLNIRSQCRRVDRRALPAPYSTQTQDIHVFDFLPLNWKSGTTDLIVQDSPLYSLPKLLTRTAVKDFVATFAAGVDAYITGDWTAATKALTQCARTAPHDLPTQALLSTLAAAGSGSRAPASSQLPLQFP